MPGEFRHPDDDDGEHIVYFAAAGDRVVIECSCGEDMTIYEEPSGETMVRTIELIVEHFSENGFKEVVSRDEGRRISEQYARIYDATKDLDLFN